MCLIEDKEIEVTSEIYRRSSKKDEDDPMGRSGQGDGVGHSAAHGNESTSAGADAEGVGQAAAPGRQNVPGTPPDPEEEYQISKDRSGHGRYRCILRTGG